jgi:hypothetical protein
VGFSYWEDDVIYREKYEADPYEERYRNIVLRQQSIYGPWFVMGLGMMLALFVAYLIYSNVFSPPAALYSPERSLWVIAKPAGVFSSQLQVLEEDGMLKSGAAVTLVPHSRATNALLGGQGPAALSALATTAQQGGPTSTADKNGMPH